jgi:transcription elongation factor Elf1
MGRRSRKRYKKIVRPQRRLPKVFQCPSCGLPTLIIDLDTYTDEVGIEKKRAVIRCMNPKCGLRATLDNLPTIYSEVDVYSKFLDALDKGEVEVTYEKSEEGEEEGEE